MEILQKRGALTHFQILGEISKQEPNLKQKDLAERLNITIQAVSENIKILTEKGYITSNDGRAPYKITQKGIAKVKKDAIILRKYSDSVLIDIKNSKALIVTLPLIKDGGSRSADMKLVKEIYTEKYKNYGFESLDKVAVIGTVSHAVANNLDIPIDIEYGVTSAAVSAIRKGLNVFILCVGDMTKNITKELEDNDIQYQVIDAKLQKKI